METTLEVRWFFKGMPPAVVQRWFRIECPGKLLETEIRTDWYANLRDDDADWLKNLTSRALNREEINLKLRQANLELKLKQRCNIHRFVSSNPHAVEGRVEQWCKHDEANLESFLPTDLWGGRGWIGVDKEREQKIERGVAIELTWLQAHHEYWWTIAFEMSQGDRRGEDSCFREVVETACQTYRGPKLSATDSYGYSRWILELITKITSERKSNASSLLASPQHKISQTVTNSGSME